MKAAVTVAGFFVGAVGAIAILHALQAPPALCFESLGQLPDMRLVILDRCRGEVQIVRLPGTGDPVLYQAPTTTSTTSTTLAAPS